MEKSKKRTVKTEKTKGIIVINSNDLKQKLMETTPQSMLIVADLIEDLGKNNLIDFKDIEKTDLIMSRICKTIRESQLQGIEKGIELAKEKLETLSQRKRMSFTDFFIN